MNRLPCAAEEEEDGGASSPNSTISSISGKRSERENIDELDIERACSRGISDEEDAENARKKLRLSKDQSAILEESFKEHNTLNPVSQLNSLNQFHDLIESNLGINLLIKDVFFLFAEAKAGFG